MSDLQAWLALLGLGAFHGINPGMGWLFAVALGLQEQRRSAVLRALLPIALGHAISIGAVVLVLGLVSALRWPPQAAWPDVGTRTWRVVQRVAVPGVLA